MGNMETTEQEFLYVGFNQDYGCFSVGCHNGFRVYNCEPFNEQFRREFTNGGIGIVEMLFRCNILAIVGGGTNPKYPQNKVMIWDDHQGRCIGELTFRNQVRAVKLRRDRIAVALEHKVLVYNFADLRLVHQWETLHNPKGLMAISSMVDSTVLACPGLHVGQVRVELCNRRQTKFITAHQASLACIALSLNGSRLATSSDKGTLIRIFNTSTGQKLQELRRGSDQASIYSLTFDKCCEWMAVSSDKGTVHVFALAEPVRNYDGIEPPPAPAVDAVPPNRSNPGSWLTMAKGFVPLPTYFSSEWSFAQFKVPEESVALVGFGLHPHTLVIITKSGSLYKVQFDARNGGPMEQLSYVKFIDTRQELPTPVSRQGSTTTVSRQSSYSEAPKATARA